MHQEKDITITKKQLIIAVLLILLLIICSVAVGMRISRRGSDAGSTSQKEGYTPDLDPDAEDWTGEQPEDKSDEEAVGIKIPGYPSITLPANQETVAVSLLNPEGNPCYFTFELVLKENDEVLYTSKQVPPGQVISEITLSRPLSAGEYEAVIRISTASLEDGSAMNGANMETVLIVQ